MDLKDLHIVFCKYFSIEKGRTEATVKTYKYNFDEFSKWLINNGHPVDILSLEDHKILRGFMYDLSERKLDKKTIRQRMLSLKSFCKYLVREDILQKNPFDRFDIPKKENSLPNPLSNDVRDMLMVTIKRTYDRTKSIRDLQAVVMLELGLKSGLR